MIKTKCLWDKPEPSDGFRILVTRFWPRGKKKEFVDYWDPNLGPSKELLLSYKNGKVTWHNYEKIYRKERESAWAQKAIEGLKEIHRKKKNITLVCYEKDNDPKCHRYILKEIVNKSKHENS
jgi:uncharacterized protein YeaO (DUF488 family)